MSPVVCQGGVLECSTAYPPSPIPCGRLMLSTSCHYLFGSHISQALHLPFISLPIHQDLSLFITQFLPKAMFEFVFEGELLAFTVNGETLLLLALLPRRKPRTVNAAALSQPHR